MLVAFAIASAALIVLYRGGAEGLVATRQAARMDEALARARSRIAAVCQEDPPHLGERSGDDGNGFTWHTQIASAGLKTLVPPDPEQRSPSVQAQLLAVKVTMSWQGPRREREVSLETRCMAVGPTAG